MPEWASWPVCLRQVASEQVPAERLTGYLIRDQVAFEYMRVGSKVKRGYGPSFHNPVHYGEQKGSIDRVTVLRRVQFDDQKSELGYQFVERSRVLSRPQAFGSTQSAGMKRSG